MRVTGKRLAGGCRGPAGRRWFRIWCMGARPGTKGLAGGCRGPAGRSWFTV